MLRPCICHGVASPEAQRADEARVRANLLAGKSGVEPYSIRHVGDTIAGVCHFDVKKHQNRKELRRGKRAGSIAIGPPRRSAGQRAADPRVLALQVSLKCCELAAAAHWQRPRRGQIGFFTL